MRQYSAVALFNERAAAVRRLQARSTPNSVVEIVTRLDGLPLAMEHCGRAKLLQPQAILPRLQKRLQLLTGGAQDLPGRQQTMRNAIDWSYGLLTPDEQQFFRKLSVFVGGWTWRPPRRTRAPATTRTWCSRA